MDIEQIHDFLAVAKYKNFSKAAEVLYIGQPALSRRITKLEKQLGVRLFVRDSKAVELTAAGKVLYEEGWELVKEVERLEERIRAVAQERGTLRIVTMGHISNCLSATIKRTAEAMPDCDVELNVLMPSKGGGLERTEEWDIAFTVAETAERLELGRQLIPLEEVPFAFLMPKEHPLARLDEVRPEDLNKSRLLLLEVGKDPSSVQMLIQAASEQVMYRKSVESIALDVSVGKGIGFLPSFEAENCCRWATGLTTRKAVGLPEKINIFLVHRKDNQNPAIERFVRTFMENLGGALNSSLISTMAL